MYSKLKTMVEDHYKVLGLSRNASKGEIKDAFRMLAIKFHPDKHSQSPKPVREGATLRFKQVSEAYEVLSDDRKRAYYDSRSRSGFGASSTGGGGYGYGYNHYSHGSGSNHSGRHGKAYEWSRFESALRFLSTRAFLRNLSFAGVLLGGMLIMNTSMETIWNLNNSGKSFEAAMESIKGVEKSMAEITKATKEVEETMESIKKEIPLTRPKPFRDHPKSP